MELKDATIDMLGRARQVKVSKENTIIVGGAGDKEAIADRVAQIKNQFEVTTSDYDREKLMERLAKSVPAALPSSRSARLPRPR